MNSSTIRRLATDQASLRRSIPPNYLFPEDGEGASLPDDLTQLVILLTGAHGTPYSQGLWRLHLKMPDDYPKNPPKATFKTRIYHPNVEESTGSVCLDTLKKDWQSNLTLRDVLITIGCLLIHPNPDSALNSAAGSLLQEDYEAFAKQAKLMTSIHAPIPSTLKSAVQEAKHRGEEDGVVLRDGAPEQPVSSRASSSTSSLVMKKKKLSAPRPPVVSVQSLPSSYAEDQYPDQQDEGKENDPAQSPSPAPLPPSSPRKPVLGKRPLTELPAATQSEEDDLLESDAGSLTASEKNIRAGEAAKSLSETSEPVRKSPKLEKTVQDLPPDTKTETQDMQIYEDNTASSSTGVQPSEDEKENTVPSEKGKEILVPKISTAARPTLRKVSNVGSTRGKGQARTGIRRL